MEERRDMARMAPPPGMGMGGKGGPGGPGGPGRRFQEPVKPKNTKETIRRLLTYLGHHKYLLLLALIFVVIGSVLSILASYMIRPIINGLLEGAGTQVLLQNLLCMAGIYAVANLCKYLQSRIMLEIAQNALAKLREDLFNAMQTLPIRFYDRNKNGDVMSRYTNDVDIINQMLSNTAVSLVSGVFTLATTVIIMLYTNWFLALITLSISPLFSWLSKTISKKSMVYYKTQQASLGKLNGYIEEQVTGQKVIKVFNHECPTVEAFQALNTAYRNQSFRAQFLSGMMGPLMGCVTQLGYLITACVGGVLCILGRFDVGGFTVFLSYSKSFARPVNEIFSQVNTVFSALAGAERVFEVMNHPPEADHGKATPAMQGAITFADVTFGYRPGAPVLRGLTLRAEPSQKIAFVGATGAGKTTITNLLNRFYEIQNGTICIDGVNIQQIEKEHLRKNIAMVLQDTHLFTGTILENVRYGRLDATDEEVIAACKTANADPFIRRLADGYQTVLTGDGANLSGGQRQLLNIARAAISKAPILVLDEATSSVDTRTERQIEQALDRLMQQRTTFVIAHRLSTVRNSDKIIVLEAGRILESGHHQALLDQQGRYYELYTGAMKLQ